MSPPPANFFAALSRPEILSSIFFVGLGMTAAGGMITRNMSSHPDICVDKNNQQPYLKVSPDTKVKMVEKAAKPEGRPTQF